MSSIFPFPFFFDSLSSLLASFTLSFISPGDDHGVVPGPASTGAAKTGLDAPRLDEYCQLVAVQVVANTLVKDWR
jgi:hypothetical protein